MGLNIVNMIKKFKVGDMVRVRETLIGNTYYGDCYFPEEMLRFSGRILEIDDIKTGCYFIKDCDCPFGSGWYWTDEMLEEPKPKTVKSNKWG